MTPANPSFFELIFTLAFLVQLIRAAIPFVFAALAGTISERSGVINIALEAKLLIGAFCYAVGAIETGSIAVGVVCGMLGGVAIGALYSLLVIRFRADQIVCGVAVNLLALALTRFLLKLIYDSSANSPAAPRFEGSLWTNPFLWGGIAIVAGVNWTLWRSRFGLNVRACGEHPETVTTVGLSPDRIRWSAVLLAGALAGLGGAWLALDIGRFSAEMSSGRGYIALAAVIMGRWRPLLVVAACLAFAAVNSLQVNLQTSGVGLPREFIAALPYLFTLVVLAGFGGKSTPPAALGK